MNAMNMLVLSTALVGWAASAAVAQERAAAAEASPDQPAVPGSRDRGLEEVIVTAERRVQSIQDAPLSVTAVSGSALVDAGVADLRGLSQFAPSISIINQGDATQIFLRGIGQGNDREYTEPGTAVYIDQVYTPRNTIGNSLFDIAQVELLPGPQGTLYGKNAAGGALSVRTNIPGDRHEASGTVEFGNYSLLHATGIVNIPLSESFALRAAVDSIRHDGYLSNGQDDQETIAGRLTALYSPTEYVAILLRAEYGHQGGDGKGIPSNPLARPGDAWFQPDDFPGENIFFDLDYWKVNAEINLDLDGLVLTYVPAYIHYDDSYVTPLGGGNTIPALLKVPEISRDQYSQELRLARDTDPLKWVVGLYWFDADVVDKGVEFAVPAFDSSAFSGFTLRSRSYAAFGQLTYSILDPLRLTAGGRYSIDEKEGQGSSGFISGGVPFLNAFEAEVDDERFDWRFGLEYDVTPDSMLYATIQTGFIGGGFNTAGTNETFEPETLTAYTVGGKGSFLDNRLQINNEVFYYVYENLQVSAFSALVGNSLVHNAEDSIIYGDQLQIRAQITGHLELDADIAYLYARIEDAMLPPFANAGEDVTLVHFSNTTLPYSPELSASIGLTYTWDLPGGATVVGRASTRLETEAWLLYTHESEALRRDSFTKSDLSVIYTSADGRWSIGAWVRNAENSDVLVTTAAYLEPGQFISYVDPPRTYGVRLGVSFQ